MLTKADELALSTFERKVLQKIYGSVYERGEWRIRYNYELYQLYKTPNITRVIKITRLRWAGHLQMISDNEIPRKLWNVNRRVEGVLGGLDFDGRMEWWMT
jgi:hypothetical protein